MHPPFGTMAERGAALGEPRSLFALPGGFRRKKRAVEQVTVVLESGQMREIKGILNAAIGAGLRGSSGPVAAGGFN